MEVSGVGLNYAQPLQKRLQHQLILAPAIIVELFLSTLLAVLCPVSLSLGPLFRRHVPDVDFIEVIVQPLGEGFLVLMNFLGLLFDFGLVLFLGQHLFIGVVDVNLDGNIHTLKSFLCVEGRVTPLLMFVLYHKPLGLSIPYVRVLLSLTKYFASAWSRISFTLRLSSCVAQ